MFFSGCFLGDIIVILIFKVCIFDPKSLVMDLCVASLCMELLYKPIVLCKLSKSQDNHNHFFSPLLEREEEKEREFVVHVPLPDQKEIEKMYVLEKKKMDLLREYASEDLVKQQTEANAMLNIQRQKREPFYKPS